MKKTRKILALALAAMMLLSAFSMVISADEVAAEGRGRVVDGYDPIPLLIIKINFDADGDGKNNYESDDPTLQLAHKNKDKAQYGEQWCYSEDSFWYDICFGDGHYTLNSYYKYISNDRFWWVPVEETCGTANDSVVTVTLNMPHPNRAEAGNADGGLGSGNERRLAIEAADQYVDFSKYDKNGDGKIDFTEMTVMYIYGGYEIAYAGKTSYKYAFPTHAHVSEYTTLGLECDGVSIYSSAQPYVRMGERGSSDWSQYGTVAHELGHVLGAKDLYTNSEGWIGGCGNLSLMGSGSKGRSEGRGDVGTAPTVLDPYYSVLYGFSDETVASSATKEYVLYSHESELGEYNVIRINTKNPNEYYLIENRSHSTTGYDNNGLNADENGNSMQGILIWHIDEGIISSTARPNNASEGHAAGFTVITPTDNIQDVDANSTWSSISAKSVFVASNEAAYKFPVSNAAENPGTWYTAMTPEEAAQCNIKIEFLTEPGNEMTIRVSGAIDLPVEVAASVADKTQTTMKIASSVKDYNGAALTACKFFISEESDMSNAIEKTVPVTNESYVEVEFDGLKSNTEYYYKVEVTSTHGTSVTRTSSAYTSSPPVVNTKAKVTLVVNSDFHRTTTMNGTVGSVLKISIPLEKKGYTFGGWYLDAEYTQEYDFAAIESTDPFTLYAKWVANSTTSTTQTTTDPNVAGDQNSGDGDASSSFPIQTVVIIAVAAVVVIGGGAAVVVIVNKKKTK